MRKGLTPRDRLALLVPWINGEPVPRLKLVLLAFLGSFDGTAASGFVQTYSGWLTRGSVPSRLEPAARLTPAHLVDVRARLVEALERGFRQPVPKGDHARVIEYPSLRFGVRGTGRPPLGTPLAPAKGTLRARFSEREALRRYRAPGAYVLLVDGTLLDMVPFLALHLLKEPGMARLTRCPAPAPNDWTQRCGKFVLTHGMGRPSIFCSEGCKVRRYAETHAKKKERKRDD